MRPVLLYALLAACAARALPAQAWRDGNTVPLIVRATAQRTARDADTLLAAWRAEARGVVRMASVVDHDGVPVERLIRADELRVEVYGEAPNRSKQIIVAWRDTTFLPNRIRYHRDHLGIVANDFGGTIRLGDGDEVRDLVHPLSAAGLLRYEFLPEDTLRISSAKGELRVVSILVRPRDPAEPGTVGTLYLDIDRAALVRFQFTFTAAAYRDPTVEDITVTLENALREGARWLPWRQAIAIRRREAILDLPVRSILRADWTLDDYALGVRHPETRFAGPAIDGLRRAAPGGTWTTPLAGVVDTLPFDDAALRAVREAALRAVAARRLNGLPRTRFLGGGLSDLLHVDRVQGVALGAGVSQGLGAARLHLRAGYGTADRRVTGRLGLALPVGRGTLELGASRALLDAGDAPPSSRMLNSLRSAFGGDDLGDWTLVERLGVALQLPVGEGRLSLWAGRERSWSVAARFTPVTGMRHDNPPLGAGGASVLRAAFTRRAGDGVEWHLATEAGHHTATWGRAMLRVTRRVAVGDGALVLRADGGAGTTALPPWRDFVLGGPGTLPGVPHRALGGRRAARAELGWERPLGAPTPPFPYARYLPLPSTITPFVAAGVAGGDHAGVPWRGSGRIEGVAGVRVDLWGPLLRVEGGVSFRTGRIDLRVDAHPDWWPVL